MPRADLGVYRLRQPLRSPYRLSFATLTTFDTLIVRLSTGRGDGFGEITPLPGYSDETVDSALAALDRAAQALTKGTPFDEVVRTVDAGHPMTASALVCARETLEPGEAIAFERPIAARIPMAALCGGDTPAAAAAAARALQQEGYAHLKLKAGGGDIADDIARLRAVAGVTQAGVDLSIDANQRLTVDAARRLCDAAAALPVLLVEQPFPPDAWDDFASLAEDSPVSLMLDESIWTAEDIDRAAAVGANRVKLKLCKHPGMKANLRLIEHARGLGLEVIYGNGVQGALGNHLEAELYVQAGLTTPGELNGVLKLADDPFGASVSIEKGYLADRGMRSPGRKLDQEDAILAASFML